MEEGQVSDGDAGTHLASILIPAASVAPVAAVAPGPEPAFARLYRAGRGSAGREPSAPSLVEGLPTAPPAATTSTTTSMAGFELISVDDPDRAAVARILARHS
jgi:hypothetical protein